MPTFPFFLIIIHVQWLKIAAAAVAAAAEEADPEAAASDESPKIDAFGTKPLAAYNRFGHKAPQASRPAVDHSGSLGKVPCSNLSWYRAQVGTDVGDAESCGARRWRSERGELRWVVTDGKQVGSSSEEGTGSTSAGATSTPKKNKIATTSRAQDDRLVSGPVGHDVRASRKKSI